MDSINNKEKAGEQTDLAFLQRRIEALEKEKQQLQAELGLLGSADQELAGQKKEFGTVLDHLLDVVARYDRELRCLYINAAAQRALGLEVDFFIGRTIHQLGMPVEQVALWDKTIRQVFESAQPQIMEFELPTLKGLRYYRTDVVPEFALETSHKNSNGYDFNSSRTVSSVLCISHDITELKQTEEKLRLKERQYRTLVELSPDTISLYDRELRHVYISPAVEKRSGYPPEFFLGKNAEELGMPLEAREQWEAVGRKVFETGQPQILEFKSWLGNRERFSQVLFSPEMVEDGKTVEFILGIDRDVTEIKLAQRALEERERQYRTLIENSPDIITRYDENLRVTFVNSTVEASTGRPSQFYVGKSLSELGVAEQQINSIKQVFESGEPRRLEYSVVIPGSGETRYFQARIIPEFDGPGENEDSLAPAGSEANRNTPNRHTNPGEDNSTQRKVQSVVTITTDITALKYSELALATQKERLDITLRSIAEGVIATDPQGRITVFNARAETLTGWPLEKALGQSFEKVVRLFDEGQQAFLNNLVQQVLEKREMVKLGSAIAKPIALLPYSLKPDLPQDDQDSPESVHENNPATTARKLIEGWASPLYEGAKSESGPLGMVFIFEDVTQHRRIEEELQKADKIQAVGVLAAGIAHDFNNFLAAILGNLAFIRRNLPETNSLSKNLFEAENACLSARSLTQQLLTFAQGGTPVKKAIAIGELLEETASFILRGTSTRCQVKVAGDLWQAELDAGQISQVIYNLVLNGQQAMPEGGVVRVRAKNVLFSDETGETGNSSTLKNQDHNKAQAEPDLKEVTIIQETLPIKPGPYIQLEVQDDGTGIPDKYLSRIFDPYFTTKQKGNGLGLSVCYSIIKNHEGYINVVSEPGIGTTFFVYLPALGSGVPVEVSALPVSKEKLSKRNNEPAIQPAYSPGPEVANLRVLVMDDQEMILELVKDVLADGGHKADLVHDGEEAIARYQKALEQGQPYDVVIMDLTIPGRMGGKETIVELQKLDPGIKAIVSSGYSNDPITSNYQEYGFKAVLPKPFDIDELLALVERLA